MKHSIIDVMQHYGVNVRETSGWQKCKCPVHEDSHASAGVHVDECMFVCHACGVKGDVYKIIMEKEGVSYYEAIGIAEGITGKSRTEIQGFNTSSRRVSSQARTNVGRRGYVPPGGGRRASTRSRGVS